MSNQLDDSGEYGAIDILAMAERLKTLCPRDLKTGKINQSELAEEMGMSQSTLSSILAGRPMSWHNHRKVIMWLQKTGRTAEDILWWQIGERQNPQMAAGGLAERRKVPRHKVSFPLRVVPSESPSPRPSPPAGRRSGLLASRDKR